MANCAPEKTRKRDSLQNDPFDTIFPRSRGIPCPEDHISRKAIETVDRTSTSRASSASPEDHISRKAIETDDKSEGQGDGETNGVPKTTSAERQLRLDEYLTFLWQNILTGPEDHISRKAIETRGHSRSDGNHLRLRPEDHISRKAIETPLPVGLRPQGLVLGVCPEAHTSRKAIETTGVKPGTKNPNVLCPEDHISRKAIETLERADERNNRHDECPEDHISRKAIETQVPNRTFGFFVPGCPDDHISRKAIETTSPGSLTESHLPLSRRPHQPKGN